MAGERKHQRVPFELGKGLLSDTTARGAVRRYHDGDNVRWHAGLPQKMGGYVELEVRFEEDEESDPPRLLQGRARAYLEWDSLDGQNWIAIGTHCKLYLINNGVLYDITPLRHTSSIVDGFTTQAGSDLVTVYDPSHGAQDGDHVNFTGATAVGGITIAGEYHVVEVIDLDTYTIRHTSTASSSATGGGVVTASYDIPCGLETDGTLKGYGTGPYGEGTYGTERENSTFGGYARVWSLDNWGEDLLASPNGETLFVWERRLGPGSRARRVEGAPENIEHMLVGPDDRHVIAFGANLASTGQQDRMFVRWCAGDDYATWLATAENDAGSKRLDIGSRLITAVKTRQGILIFSDKGLYWLSVIGGQDVYSIQSVGEIPKIVGKRGACDAGGTVYAFCENDFYVWDGTFRLLPCEIREYVFGDGTADNPGINRIAQSKAQVTWIKEFEEVRFEFPYGDSLENNRCAIYNIAERCWYKSSIVRETYGDKNGFFGYPIGVSNGRIYLHENGVDADGQPLPSFLESFEAELGTGDYELLVSHLYPDFKRLIGSVAVTVFGRTYPADTRRSVSAGVCTASTTQLDPRFRGRQFGIRIESNGLGDFWRMGDWTASIGPVGSR